MTGGEKISAVSTGGSDDCVVLDTPGDDPIISTITGSTTGFNIRRRLSQIIQDMPKRYSFDKTVNRYTYLTNEASDDDDDYEDGFKVRPDANGEKTLVNHQKSERKQRSIWSKEIWYVEKQRLGVVLLMFVLFVMAIFLLWTYVDRVDPNNRKFGSVAKTGQSDTSDICLTPACVRIAALLLDSVDFTKNPCENFYDYACGNWRKNNPIPDDKPKMGAFVKVDESVKLQIKGLLEDTSRKNTSKLIEFTKQYYAKCLDMKTIDEKVKSVPLQQMIRDMGGWPFLNQTWQHANQSDLTEIWARMFKRYSKDAFLKIYVTPDTKNMPENIMLLDQGDLGLGPFTRQYYLNQTAYATQIEAYKKLIFDYVSIIARDMQISGFDELRLKADIERILTFERELANITVAEEHRRNSTLLYNKWTMGQLQKAFPLIDWNRLLKLKMPNEVYVRLVDKKFDSYEFLLTQPDYLRKLNDLLTSTDKRILVNYMIWVTVQDSAHALDARFEEAEQSFKLAYMGRPQKPVRWKKCVAYTLLLDMSSGSMYVRDYFTKHDKIEALDMINYLKEAFNEILDHLDWMDPETKRSAFEKIGYMYNKIGYPDFILNDTALDDYYKNLTLDTENVTFFDLQKRISSWYQDKDWYDLLQTFDRTRFSMNPSAVNAFYSSEMNAITFPAGILQPPFFHGDFPKYINYGAMGAVIGHEITHGFDDQGSQYDQNGYLKNWWSHSAQTKFDSKKQCIIDQYDKFAVPGLNLNVNGLRTQGENIADNGGLKEAFLAYRKYEKKLGRRELRLPALNLSNEQAFFLSFSQFWCSNAKPASLVLQVLTDAHSPEMFRVVGPMSNSYEFASAFRCPAKSPMNPPEKCSVW